MKRDKQINSTDWLTKGYTKEELARMIAEAIKEAETEFRDKQIGEMTKVICENTAISCYETAVEIAEELTAKGYRKASDVAREIFEEIEKVLEQSKEIADVRIRELAPHTYKVMQEAGKLYHKHDSNAIAELKKKYESEKDK